MPPTDKKCKLQKKALEDSESDTMDEVVQHDVSVKDSGVKSGSRKKQALKRSAMTPNPKGQNCKAKRAQPQGSDVSADEDHSPQEGSTQADVQLMILKELRRVNSRLDVVEEQVAEGRAVGPSHGRNCVKLSSTKVSNSKVKKVIYTSESSDDEQAISSLSELRSSTVLQKKVDAKVKSLDQANSATGNDQIQKLKSKRGGNVDVVVSHKVAWPHEHILGGASKQRLTYDQLNLTQFIQGFAKNILEEKDQNCHELMLQYMADLMEDTNDFTWSNAKAAHAVLLCEMERGVLTWHDTNKIDRIRRAHAQKHTIAHKQNWGRNSDFHKKPWFCKAFQPNSCTFYRDHEVNGKLHRHICAHCLSVGKIMNHSQKECGLQKKVTPKNEVAAAQI